MNQNSVFNCKVLILNGESRNGLAIIRSLGRNGYLCDIVTYTNAINQKLPFLFKSKYVRKVHCLARLNDEDKFLHEFINLLKFHKYDFIIPAGTEYSNFLSKYKNDIAIFSQPLIENYEKIWHVHNKINCMLWAESIGVPVPKTFVIKNLNDLIAAANQINFPVVIKNPDSFASEGLWTCSDGAEKLLEEYKRRIPQIVTGVEREFPIIQKKITGQLFDSTSFVIKGQTVGMLTQERILTAWLDGGGGLVNITNDIPEIKEYTQKIIKELKWTGPIEMDWIKDSDSGRYYLIEINPKFWGTTQLTISSGLDYPDFLMRFATNKPIKKISEYKIGLMYRWIMDELFAILTMSQNRQRLFAEIKGFIERFNYRPVETDVWISDIKPSLKKFISLSISYFLKGGILKTLKILRQ